MIRKETANVYSIGKKPGVTQVEFFTNEKDVMPDLLYIHSFPGVTIRSHEPSWGSIPVNGRERLKTLRDGMIEVCKHFGIE